MDDHDASIAAFSRSVDDIEAHVRRLQRANLAELTKGLSPLEAARIHIGLGERSKAMAIRSRLAASLGSDFKRLQFDGYWARYIDRASVAG